MPIAATTTRHGAASFDALAAAVRDVQGHDPLAPVTIIVPTNTAGVMARRALGRRGGAANVDVLTLYRLAELLAARSLVAEARTPVSTPVVDIAVREALARTGPGLYGDVAHHPSTVVALRDLYREVRLAGRGAMTALGRTRRGREPSRILVEVARALAGHWYDEGDLLERAAALARDALAPRFGHIIVHDLQRLRPLELELLRTLGEIGDVGLLVARSGDDEADRPVLDMVAELVGGPLPDPPDTPPPPGRTVRIHSTTDADEEVRLGVRAVLDGARGGTRFDRMAILWPSDRPYARLVEHHLDTADLAWNGRPGTTVLERMVPRVLAELLDLDRRGVRRVALMTLLGDVAARRPDGRPVPVAAWERIAREAGIVRETDWDTHLPRWLEETAAAEPSHTDIRQRVADGESLQRFVVELRTALGDPALTRTWSSWVAWCETRVAVWFGPALERLPDVERIALQQTQRVLDRLRNLDRLGSDGAGRPVTRAEVRATFLAEMDAVPARRGTLGDGVHVGSLSGARGLDLDLVVVLGAADGLLPPPPSVDPLLSDDDRAAAGLVTSDERARHAHRQFLAATQTTPEVTITVPRGDLRATTAHQPSRWLTPLVAHGAIEEMLDSHAHGLSAAEFPLSEGEHRRRALWVHRRAGGDIRQHPRVLDDAAARRGLRLIDARASDDFTPYDGDLSSRSIDVFSTPMSPTRLEAWATCPHAFFVQYVLGVRPIDEPGELVTIDPRDRGTVIHQALHRLHQLVLDGTVEPPGPDGWHDGHLALLTELTQREADRLERSGRSGRAAYWATARAVLIEEVRHWVRQERAGWVGQRIALSEASFGERGDVTLALTDGRRLAFRGSIDRVDQHPDGTLVVTDHKTGKADRFKDLDTDPTIGGTHFQLPIYAAAARALTGRPDAPVRAEYSFFARGGFARHGADLDDEAWRRASEQLSEVVAGIEHGVFIARPDKPGWQLFVPCVFCDPDGLGTAERWPEWERKHLDRRLARWYAEPDDAAVGADVGSDAANAADAADAADGTVPKASTS
ncbi:MAG: PD-(D/E)XK nuclease family protein [Desertimonas sp.]